ncbi:MAG: MBL fold metallo-hydrolase [Geobacteraceae bacterium]|nr:MBL fold metallo-hydrolase [Geobacteraceae bacterium]
MNEIFPKIVHHGALHGVTGSCHELRLSPEDGILVDCGLFQGDDVPDGCDDRDAEDRFSPLVDFPIEHIKALVVTHVHLDHVGRIPYLLAAGFKGPIYCSEPSAVLLPLMLEDAVKIGISHDQRLIEGFLDHLKTLLVPLPYGQWRPVAADRAPGLAIRLQPAGHILGSAYVEVSCPTPAGTDSRDLRVVFSGDLGAPYTPLLPAPRPPYRADLLVLESTYGDRLHEGRQERRHQLQQVIERALQDRGVVLVPAFSIGRTQELLYELEEIIFHCRTRQAAEGMPWDDLEIIVDSPLASRFTEAYRQLQPFWDAEARGRVRAGRHPLSFEQLTTIDSHADHENTVAYLCKTARPCVVIAAGGMCSGGRIVNYLKALLGDSRTDVLFVGYQAAGTPGRNIQEYGPKGGYVVFDGQRYPIRAKIHTISGYSAHADQKNLVDFVRRMRKKPKEIRLVHGEESAKKALSSVLSSAF